MALLFMKFETVGIGESLLTVAAFIGLLASVGPDVFGEVIPAGEAGRTEGTLVRLLSAVDQEMVFEIVRTNESFATFFTAERLDLRVSTFHMILQVKGCSECRIALRALVRFLSFVHENVPLHVVNPLGFPTVLALYPRSLPVS